MKLNKKKIFILSISSLFLLLVVYYFWFDRHYPAKIDLQAKPNYWGVTFSKHFAATDLKLDWRAAYLAILDDLQVKQIRLPLYWDEIEPTVNHYAWADNDWMISEGAKRNAKFIVVLGMRQPRWPECHFPDWAKNLDTAPRQQAVLDLLKQTVSHYKNNSAVTMWQVENEPLLASFGVCPPVDESFLEKEVALVKSLDNRPILITGSGELSLWTHETKLGDDFGATLYRVVWDIKTGYFHYFFPAQFYDWRLALNHRTSNTAIVAELQAEPWSPNGGLYNFPVKEADKSFDLQQFKANLQYAINLNWQAAYLWGAEWWYYQKQQGNSEYWDLAKQMLRQ